MRSPHLDSFGGHQDFEQVVQVVHLLHEHGGLGHDRDAHDLRLAALHGRSRQTLERLEQAEPEVAIANLRQQVGDRQAPGLQVGVPPALKGDELGGRVVLFGSRHRGERGGSKNEGCRRCAGRASARISLFGLPLVSRDNPTLEPLIGPFQPLILVEPFSNRRRSRLARSTARSARA